MLYDMVYTMSDFFAMIDTNYVLVTNGYIFPVYIFSGEILYPNIKLGTNSYPITCDPDKWIGEWEPVHID